MKRVFATLLLTLGGAAMPLSAWGQAPVPPADLYESPVDRSPSSLGEPTPLTPDGGIPTPGDEPAPADEAPAPRNEPATPPPAPRSGLKPVPPSAPAPLQHDDTAEPSPLPQEHSASPQAIAPSPESAADAKPEAKAAKTDDVPTEVITERYANRMIKIERHVTQDSERNFTNHGPWIMYAPDGTLIAKGRYEFGRRQGEWQRMYDAKDDRVVGKAGKQFTPPFIGVAQFVDDKLNGVWKIVDAQQREVRSWEFKQGRLNGAAATFFPNGKKQTETTYVDGNLNGVMTEWDSTGNVIKKTDYKDGRNTTPYVRKYPGGAKQHEGHYLGPKQIAKTNVDFWSGIVDTQIVKKEGSPKRHGKWTEFFEHGGKKFEGEFDEDQPLGLHTWWYPNGQKMAEGRFEGGKSHGHWVWWHETGLKQKDGSFEHGVQSGTWVHWKPDGKVQEVQEHSLAPISPQQAKPLVNTNDQPRQELPTEAIQDDSAPSATSPPPATAPRRISPTPSRGQAPVPMQSRGATPQRFRGGR